MKHMLTDLSNAPTVSTSTAQTAGGGSLKLIYHHIQPTKGARWELTLLMTKVPQKWLDNNQITTVRYQEYSI